MKLCVALDLPTKEENLALIQKLKSEDVWLKVGLRSYIRDGEALLREIKSINPKFKIFLDLKIHDIPNTMADAAESMIGLGVDMFNVHASSGVKAMKMVMEVQAPADGIVKAIHVKQGSTVESGQVLVTLE